MQSMKKTDKQKTDRYNGSRFVKCVYITWFIYEAFFFHLSVYVNS